MHSAEPKDDECEISFVTYYIVESYNDKYEDREKRHVNFDRRSGLSLITRLVRSISTQLTNT